MEKNVSGTAEKLVLIGGSAGSLEVIFAVLPKVQPRADLAIIIVLHRKGGDESGMLLSLLNDKTSMPVKEVEEKEIIRGGHVYVAPGDYHLLVEQNRTLSLDFSEKINYSRPSIDVAFETGAEAYGPRACAILLSGASKDGTDGLKAINSAGGISVVQTPGSSIVNFMPSNAIAYANPARVLATEEMAAFINQL